MRKLAMKAAFAGAALVGMATLSAPAQDEPALGKLQHVRGPADVTLPLSQIDLGDEEWQLLYAAQRVLGHRCAAQYGVTSTEPAAVTTPAAAADNSRRYGLLDVAVTARYGYHDPEAVQPTIPDEVQSWEPTDREYKVMTGLARDGRRLPSSQRPVSDRGEVLPPEGCSGRAASQLAAGRTANSAYLEGLSFQTFQAAESDSRVRAVWQRWATCMQRHGYDYNSPWEPNDHPWGQAPSEQERATAMDDLRCRQQVRLVDTWFTVEVAYQRQVLRESAAGLASWRETMDERLDRARKVVATAQPEERAAA